MFGNYGTRRDDVYGRMEIECNSQFCTWSDFEPIELTFESDHQPLELVVLVHLKKYIALTSSLFEQKIV